MWYPGTQYRVYQLPVPKNISRSQVASKEDQDSRASDCSFYNRDSGACRQANAYRWGKQNMYHNEDGCSEKGGNGYIYTAASPPRLNIRLLVQSHTSLTLQIGELPSQPECLPVGGESDEGHHPWKKEHACISQISWKAIKVQHVEGERRNHSPLRESDWEREKANLTCQIAAAPHQSGHGSSVPQLPPFPYQPRKRPSRAP